MKVFLVLLVVSLLAAATIAARQSEQSKTYTETRQLLFTMGRTHDDGALKKLFEESTARRSDLIKALYDPEVKVSVNAQTIIKYVADPAALAGIEEWIASRRQQGQGSWISPVEIINEVRYLRGRKSDLVGLILRNEFRGQKDGWGELIAYESTSKCALVEIVFGRGFTQGWHVAVRKESGKWRVLSKSLIWEQ
jgi:hypothetical protein